MPKPKTKTPASPEVGFIRATSALWDRVRASAEADHRTLTGQTIALLEEALDARDAARENRPAGRK